MDKSKIENLNKQEYTHLPHAEQEFENHEQTDVSIRGLVVTLGTLAAVIVFSYAGMWGLFELFKYQTQTAEDNQPRTTVVSGLRSVPEGMPALQGVPAAEANANTPAQDMIKLRKRNTAVMNGQEAMRTEKQQPGMRPGMPINRAIDEAMTQKMFKTRTARGAAGGAAASQSVPEAKEGEPSAGQQK